MRDRPIELSPLQLTEIDAEGVHLVVCPGVEPEVDRVTDDLLCASLEDLGILVFGSNRQSLSDSLEQAIADAWIHYMELDEEEPTGDLCRIRFQLISRFRPY